MRYGNPEERACARRKARHVLPAPSPSPRAPSRLPFAGASSLSDLAQRAGLGRIGALIRPFLVAGGMPLDNFRTS